MITKTVESIANNDGYIVQVKVTYKLLLLPVYVKKLIIPSRKALMSFNDMFLRLL